MPDVSLDADEIRAATFVRHVEIHDTLSSTNDRATDLATDPTLALPALVVARNQNAGRGRGSHTWWSANGALTFSVVIDPAAFGVGTTNWPQLSLATAVAICNALSTELTPHSALPTPHSAGLAIKWPNDILLHDRKICGILIESPGGLAPAKDRLVVGIGINVNNSLRQAPSDLAGQATALCDASNRQHSLPGVLIQVLNELQHRFIGLGSGDPDLPRAWQSRCWLTQQNVSVQVGTRTIEGICTGIADDGALLVKTAVNIERIYSGSVQKC